MGQLNRSANELENHTVKNKAKCYCKVRKPRTQPPFLVVVTAVLAQVSFDSRVSRSSATFITR